MKTRACAGLALVSTLLFVSPAWPEAAAPAAPRKVEVGGHKMRLLVEGTGREGWPTVVLVGRLGDPLEVWKTVQPRIAEEPDLVVWAVRRALRVP